MMVLNESCSITAGTPQFFYKLTSFHFHSGARMLSDLPDQIQIILLSSLKRYSQAIRCI